MRRLIFVLALLLMPIVSHAQHNPADEPNAVAAGAEKEAHKTAHPDEQHGGGPGHAPKTYFGIPGWIWKLANMLLFFGVLAYFVGPGLKTALASRGTQIRQEAEEARARRAKADQLAGDIQARLTQIELEVRSIHERAQQEGERQKRELLAAAEAEAAKILQAARSEVDNRLKHARKELTEFAGELAADRAEAILRERITPEDQKKLFRDSVSEVSGGHSS